MNLDPEKLEIALAQFAQNLPDIPKWVGLVDHTGQLIATFGSFDYAYPASPTSLIAGQQMHLCAERNYDALEAIEHGNFEISIHIGGEGTLFLLNMNDAFYLGVSYHGTGDGCCYSSIDATEEAIRHGSQLISNAIYFSIVPEIPQPRRTEEEMRLDDESELSPRQLMDEALQSFLKGLPGKPRWAMVIDDKEQLLGFSGEMHKQSAVAEFSLNPDEQAPLLGRYIRHTSQAIDYLHLKPFKYLVLSTGQGFTFFDDIPLGYDFPNDCYVVFNYLELQVPINTVFESVRLQVWKITQIIMDQ